MRKSRTYKKKQGSRRAAAHAGNYLALLAVLVLLVLGRSPWRTADTDTAVAEETPAAEVQMTAAPEETAVVQAAEVTGGSLTLPNGSTLTTADKRADLTGLTSADLSTAVSDLAAMPQVAVIDIGSSSLSLSEIASLRSVSPSARIVGTVNVMGAPVSTRTTSLDLTGISHDSAVELASVLPIFTNLTYVALGDASSSPELSWDDIGALQAACPDAAFDYTFSLYDNTYSTANKVFDLNHISMSDEGAAVRDVLPYMTECGYLDMDSCGVSNDAMASIRDDFPGMKVVWRVNFGDCYSVRTDVVRILASKPSVGGMLNSDDCQVLNYCQDVLYLDLGHNDDIDNISFVESMPRLQVLIVAMDFFSDLSPIAACSNLEYLEMQTTYVTDLSPLSGLSKLRHLNICCLYDGVDLSPLYGMTGLERLWIGCLTPVDADQLATLQADLPNCLIDTTAYDPHDNEWRQISWDIETGIIVYADRYIRLRAQFGYEFLAYSFDYNDPKY